MLVIAIIGILLGMATLAFMYLNEKYKVESMTKEIYSALMRARNTASTTKVPWAAVVVNPFLMQTGPDAGGAGNIDRVVGHIASPGFNINTPANIRFTSQGLFNTQGLVPPTQTQIVSITGMKFGATPAMDCIAIETTRINIGKMRGGNCDQR
jgi:hypothetical protein